MSNADNIFVFRLQGWPSFIKINYYEHIIRNEKSHNQIAEYIQTNPLKWQDDKYYV